MALACIKSVAPGSIAQEIGLVSGDSILKINGTKINDVLDYRFLSADEVLELEVQKCDGSIEIIEVETDYEELGIEFEHSLLDMPKHCTNHCIFCFIDQLPRGMRETLYFKDDDARLSFLQGNYITLTNLRQSDLDRIIKMRISPVNVSVHTTDPALRCEMLGNRHAGDVYARMKRLADNHIRMNCQIVLCPGINDGDKLDRTIADLAALYPQVSSVSAVPVGLTRYREGLYPLKPYEQEGAQALVRQVEVWQGRLLRDCGSRVIFLSDECYLMAQLPLPPEEAYEGYPQLENGVGLMRSMQTEFDDALKACQGLKLKKRRSVSIATGELAYPFIRQLCERLKEAVPEFSCRVYAIRNDFFGGGVNVCGLVCGCDIAAQLKGEPLGQTLFLPASMLRVGDDVFLDDMRLSELSDRLHISIVPVENDGYQFVEKLLGTESADRSSF